MKLFRNTSGYFESKYIFNVYMILILGFVLLFDGNRSNYMFYSIQSVIVLLSLLFIGERPGLNLATSFYGFSLIILGLLPIAEYKMEVIYWGGAYLSDIAYIKTSLLVLLSVIFFRFGYEYHIDLGVERPRDNLNPPMRNMENKLTIKTIVFLAIPCYYILVSHNFDIIAMQFRGMSEGIETVFIFEWFFIKPLIFNIFFYYLLTLKYNAKKNWSLKILFFLALLFFINPLSLARFLAFSLFVPLVYLLKEYRRKNSYLFINMVFFGMIFIFPILDVFRWFALEDSIDIGINFNLDYFFAGHFDAFQNFARVVELDILTYGRQILGAVLFFIPRSIWVTKPLGSGFLLADKANLYFNNISMPFVSELYLDFSFVGLVIGMLLLGFFYRRIDDSMSKVTGIVNLTTIVKLMAYTEFCCLQFYLLRGNLLGAFAFSSSILLTVLVVYVYYFVVSNFFKKSIYGIKF